MPNEWDVEEAVENLLDLDELECRSVLDQVHVIWPVSHSLCFDYLKMAASALSCIETGYLSEWVNRTLDQYEQKGLRAAQRYMADVEDNFLCTLRGETGLKFRSAERKLSTYLRGLGGRPLDIKPGSTVYTDGSTIYVPGEIFRSAAKEDNFFLYKLIVTYQWAYIAGGTFTPRNGNEASREGTGLWLQDFLNSFPDPALAGSLYHFLETVRIASYLGRELPGLMRRKRNLPAETLLPVPADGGINLLTRMQRAWLLGDDPGEHDPEVAPFLELAVSHARHADAAGVSVDALDRLYRLFADREGAHGPAVPFLFQGELKLEEVRRARNRRIEEAREHFIQALATRIIQPLQAGERKTEEGGDVPAAPVSAAGPEEQGISLVVDTEGKARAEKAENTLVLTINNQASEPGSELERAAADVLQELGHIPEKYVSSAVGKAGSGYAPLALREDGSGQELIAPVTYDEWDYRRGDFRKNWCSLREKEIPLSRSSFLEQTLEKYHGQIIRLRYQFEMMRTRERFVRRQRDGEDIDLDAVIESMADMKAGLAPSDRLFVRLSRDERDIAVLFLVDMSNSTQGWVGRVIKESLVLLCEALEVVGDRYAIYGFSGMRRLRSDFFHVKHMEEPYDDAVKDRIASIGPREYTRMGPAIRHAVSLLGKVDSRVKLLITLSDGKPEDYDDYKGEYAIEDTRHALVEAKLADIHPFCITIDRHARNYIEHMYGDVNYIQIDDAARLPLKIPEIYRILTR